MSNITSIYNNKIVIHNDLPVGPLLDTKKINQKNNYQSFSLTAKTTTIGAYVQGIHLNGNLNQLAITEIKQALLDWKVLFFQNQDISKENHKQFAQLLGDLEQHPFVSLHNQDQLDPDVVTLAKDASQGGYENLWHNDVTWRIKPSQYAVLKAVQIPPIGGDTLWNDMGIAYDNLDDSIKAEINNLYAYHDWVHVFGRGLKEELKSKLKKQYPIVKHPIVRVIPENYRKVIFVNPVFTTSVVGYSAEKSNTLLKKLYSQIYRPEYQVRLNWEANTIAMWDNRLCQHYAVSDYYPQPRVMNRISIIGEIPLGIKDFA